MKIKYFLYLHIFTFCFNLISSDISSKSKVGENTEEVKKIYDVLQIRDINLKTELLIQKLKLREMDLESLEKFIKIATLQRSNLTSRNIMKSETDEEVIFERQQLDKWFKICIPFLEQIVDPIIQRKKQELKNKIDNSQ